jgi:hypothetical protein
VTNASFVRLALAWCVLGYLFLGIGQGGLAMVASMGSLTMAGLARQGI